MQRTGASTVNRESHKINVRLGMSRWLYRKDRTVLWTTRVRGLLFEQSIIRSRERLWNTNVVSADSTI
jgi:hypothetical protein